MGLWTNTVDRIMRRFVEKTDTCWLWKGKKDYGYGRVGMNGAQYRAHRLIYEALRGEIIPEGMVLDHLCRNRSCVNPEHMEPVTTQENILRGVSGVARNAKKTHCKRGHELAGANLYEYSGVYGPCRGCKTCRVAANKQYRERQAA